MISLCYLLMVEGVKREVEQVQRGSRKANVYNFLKTIYIWFTCHLYKSYINISSENMLILRSYQLICQTVLNSSIFCHFLWLVKKSQWIYLQMLLFNVLFHPPPNKCNGKSNIILSEKISAVSLILFSSLNSIFVMFLYSLFNENTWVTLLIRKWWMSKSLLPYPLLNTHKFPFLEATLV